MREDQRPRFGRSEGKVKTFPERAFHRLPADSDLLRRRDDRLDLGSESRSIPEAPLNLLSPGQYVADFVITE
jgi:hypothetical protein